jgi:hypothetical protein
MSHLRRKKGGAVTFSARSVTFSARREMPKALTGASVTFSAPAKHPIHHNFSAKRAADIYDHKIDLL